MNARMMNVALKQKQAGFVMLSTDSLKAFIDASADLAADIVQTGNEALCTPSLIAYGEALVPLYMQMHGARKGVSVEPPV